MGDSIHQVQRQWMPYAQAAKLYVGIDKSVLLGAIKAHQLPAYEKPITKGRRKEAQREYHSYFVCLTDVDSWIRTYWKKAFTDPLPS